MAHFCFWWPKWVIFRLTALTENTGDPLGRVSTCAKSCRSADRRMGRVGRRCCRFLLPARELLGSPKTGLGPSQYLIAISSMP